MVNHQWVGISRCCWLVNREYTVRQWEVEAQLSNGRVVCCRHWPPLIMAYVLSAHTPPCSTSLSYSGKLRAHRRIIALLRILFPYNSSTNYTLAFICWQWKWPCWVVSSSYIMAVSSYIMIVISRQTKNDIIIMTAIHGHAHQAR